jgi:hypothetical protein
MWYPYYVMTEKIDMPLPTIKKSKSVRWRCEAVIGMLRSSAPASLLTTMFPTGSMEMTSPRAE